MDARDLLRHYLEQRREAGESELVLDQMPVDEVLRMLGAHRPAAAEPPSAPAPTAPPPIAPPPTAPPIAPREVRDAAAPVADAVNWRETLRAAGGAPGLAGALPPLAGAPSPEPAPEPRTGVEGGPRPDDATISALASLEDIARSVAGCTRCPLHLSATHAVPGEGNPDADLVCVGEAPGETEDRTGRPFVGAAGQLLTKILAAISLRREDVFICNVLKHRPPGNRNPAPDEVVACSPFLVRQLELIRPRVILALGSFAAQTLLDTKLSIGKLRGTVHEYHGIPLVVTYHPAALLRNAAWKRPTWEDVQLARRILDRPRDP